MYVRLKLKSQNSIVWILKPDNGILTGVPLICSHLASCISFPRFTVIDFPFAGNLLVLRDGKIGFIDFGIVGRIPPATWLALQSLATAFQDSNFDLMAR